MVCHLDRGRMIRGLGGGVKKYKREFRLAKKKCDSDRTEESRQEYREMQLKVKREVATAKNTKERHKYIYQQVRQRDGAGKDVHMG